MTHCSGWARAVQLVWLGGLAAACAESSSDGVGGGGTDAGLGGAFNFGGTSASGGSGLGGFGGGAGDAAAGGGTDAGSGGSPNFGGTGGASGGASGSGGAPPNCTTLTPAGFSRDPNSSETYAGALGSTGVTLGGALPDRVSLQLYTNATGTFPLGTGVNANYQSCEQCVLVLEDLNETTQSAGKLYYQKSGTITVDSFYPPLISGGVKATLTNVTLEEVTIDGFTYVSTPVAGGGCLHIASLDVHVGCGNGQLETGEACDGTNLGASTCATFGYSTGQLGCTSACQYNLGNCSGFSCTAQDLGTFTGTTLTATGNTCGAPSSYDLSNSSAACAFNQANGPERLYSVTVPAGGKIRVKLTNSFDASLWATTTCTDKVGASCLDVSDTFGNERVDLHNATSAPVTYTLVVDGYSTSDCGSYTLTITEVPTPPSTWNCPVSYFGTDDGCDCACGGWDPDCDDPNSTLLGCTTGQTCVQPGVCQ
ncbi:MAG: hypothetical protein KF718_16160 [Polyangiaceae bacterium]|nr:hypothetical protein [Polyangiaceae bacterium]